MGKSSRVALASASMRCETQVTPGLRPKWLQKVMTISLGLAVFSLASEPLASAQVTVQSRVASCFRAGTGITPSQHRCARHHHLAGRNRTSAQVLFALPFGGNECRTCSGNSHPGSCFASTFDRLHAAISGHGRKRQDSQWTLRDQ